MAKYRAFYKIEDRYEDRGEYSIDFLADSNSDAIRWVKNYIAEKNRLQAENEQRLLKFEWPFFISKFRTKLIRLVLVKEEPVTTMKEVLTSIEIKGGV